MIPVLYPSTQTVFYDGNTTGPVSYGMLGRLADAISCKITREPYFSELELRYPVDAPMGEELKAGGIIAALCPDRAQRSIQGQSLNQIYRYVEPFDIYRWEVDEDGVLTVNAHHVSYRLSYNIVNGANLTSVYNSPDLAWQYLMNNCQPPNAEFTFNYKTTAAGNRRGAFVSTKVKSFREFLIGNGVSIVNAYNLELVFHGFEIWYRVPEVGDYGETVYLGKNITNGEYTKDTLECFNAIVPYWVQQDQKVVASMVQPTTPITPVKAIAMDFTEEFETQPTAAQLTTAARNYLDNYQPWVPHEVTHIEFTPQDIDPTMAAQSLNWGLSTTYGGRIVLGDTLKVYWEGANLYGQQMKVVRTVYDVLKEEYDTIELGDLDKGYVMTGEY